MAVANGSRPNSALANATWELSLVQQRQRLVAHPGLGLKEEDFPPIPEALDLRYGEVAMLCPYPKPGEEWRFLQAFCRSDVDVVFLDDMSQGVQLVALDVNACIGLGQVEAENFAQEHGLRLTGISLLAASYIFPRIRTHRVTGFSAWAGGLRFPDGGVPYCGRRHGNGVVLSNPEAVYYPTAWPMVRDLTM